MPETRKVFHEELDQLHADAVRLRFDDWFQIVNPRIESLFR